MFVLLNLIESIGIWDAVVKIATPWNLAAFALAVVLFLVLKIGRRKILPAAWIVIVLLVALPIGASVYSEIISRTTIYRLRVTVVDPQGVPVEDAKVWSSFGGEPKKVAGGWQFDIPDASKPKEGKLSIFASKESAFLTGEEHPNVATVLENYSDMLRKLNRADEAAMLEARAKEIREKAKLKEKN
ncbi:MAG: tetratricopeptide repeat protein [Acidobacteriota bacterium]|nr:tetratricopeptide repeat protein [Acidobacteriota bacterium]